MKVVRATQVAERARIFTAGESPEDMDTSILETISNHIFEKGIDDALLDRTEIEFINKIELFKTNSVEWKQAVLQYAKDVGYDAVHFSDDEVVLINLTVEVTGYGQL